MHPRFKRSLPRGSKIAAALLILAAIAIWMTPSQLAAPKTAIAGNESIKGAPGNIFELARKLEAEKASYYDSVFNPLRLASGMASFTGAFLNDNETIDLIGLPPGGSAVSPGSGLGFVVLLENGPGLVQPDENAIVTIEIPEGLTFQSVQIAGTEMFNCASPPNPGDDGPTTLTCTVQSFDHGAHGLIVVYTTVNDSATSPLQINAQYVDDDSDPSVATPLIYSVVPPPPPPDDSGVDLELIKAATFPDNAPIVDGVIAGGGLTNFGQIKYTLNLKNNSNTFSATGAVVWDVLPAGTTVVVPPLWAGTQPGVCGVVAGQVFCRPLAINSVLAPGANIVITYTVEVGPEVPAGTVLMNSAFATTSNITQAIEAPGPGIFPTPDNNPSNNFRTTQTLVTASADLMIEKTTDPAPPLMPVVGGGAFEYVLTVTNSGPSNAKDVVVTDTLPAGILFQQIQPLPPGFTCTTPPVGANGTIECKVADLPPNVPAEITIVVQAAPNQAQGVRNNTANIVSSTPDPETDNNSSSVEIGLVVEAELSIFKTGPTDVVAGETITYQVRVHNNGPSTALNVNIQDPLPLNTTFVSLDGTGALANACSHNGGTPGIIQCLDVDIPIGNHQLNLTVQVAPDTPTGTLTNTASITSAATGTINTPSASAMTTVIHSVDLDVIKTASPETVSPGQTLNYTIRVENHGPSDAAPGEFVINEIPFPPTGTTLVGAISAPGFLCNGMMAFPCTSSSPLPAGSHTEITYQVQVNSDFAGSQLTNTASVNIPGDINVLDPNPSNNASTVNTPVIPQADLAITKEAWTLAGSVFNASTTAGGTLDDTLDVPAVTGTGEIVYVLRYVNNGPSDAVNVHIRDVIPGGTILDEVAGVVATPTSGPAFSCDVNVILNNYQIDCTPAGVNPGVLPNGASGTIMFRVRVPENVADGTIIKNQASINSEGIGAPPSGFAGLLSGASRLAQVGGTVDPSSDNNTSLETQNVVRALADLSIEKVGPATVIAGTQIIYTLTVTNGLGPSDAQNVVVTDTLPPGVSFVSATSTDADVACTAAGPTVTCTLATLVAPAVNPPPIIPPRTDSNAVTITITGLVDPALAAGATLVNTASVDTSTEDPVADNNTSDPVETDVLSEATVTVVKSDSPDPVVAGTNLTYTLSVQNAGPSVANNVVITDTLPANTSFVSVTGPGPFAVAGACSHSAGVVTCNAASLDPGTYNITLVIKVNSDYPSGTISNTVNVAWDNAPGGVGGEAMDTEETTVIRVTDLELDKSVEGGSVIAGTLVDFTIKVTNNGPSDIFGGPEPGSVVITDTIPAGAVFDSYVVAGAGGFTCEQTGPMTVTCVNAADAEGNIPVGAMATIIIKLVAPPDAPEGSNFCNTATIAINPDIHPDPDPTDPVTGNNTDTACIAVTTSADLGLQKTATPVADADNGGPLPTVPLPLDPPGAVAAGGYIRYDVPFFNTGPSNAVNVVLTDAVPANTALVVPDTNPFTITATNGSDVINLTCNVIGLTGSQQIRCTPADNTGINPSWGPGVLPAGFTGLFTFTVRVNPSVSGGTIVHNAANITSGPGTLPQAFTNGASSVAQLDSTPDPNTSNNTSLPIPTLVIASSNLSVTKIVQSGVTAASNPNQTGPIGPGTDDLTNLGTTGTAVLPGTLLTYRITVTNNGPSDVSNLQLTDVLPAGLETPPGRVLGVRYVSVNPVLPSPVSWTCAPPTGINPANNPQSNGGSIVCNALGSLSAVAPNNVTAIDVTVFIDPATKADLVNTASVNATTNGVNQPVADTATLTTPVAPTSDLALTKTHTNAAGVPNGTVIAGTTFTYTITLTNNGPSASQMVSFTDTLPPFQKVTNIAVQQTPNGNGAPNFSCVATPPVGSMGNTTSVTCTGAELPPNRNADNTVNPSGTVVVVLTVLQDEMTPQPLPTTYMNCVSVDSQMSTDPDPANSTNVCHDVTVGFEADPDTATLQKSDDPDPVVAGEQLVYTIIATNNGPSAALNFRITDPLPPNVRFLAAVASPGATLVTPAVGTTGVVTATWEEASGTPGGLTGVGQQRTLTITVRVCPDVPCTTISNTATSSSETPQGDRVDNDSDTEETTVQTRAELSIVKSGPAVAAPSIPNIPSNITYTLNFNNAGPSNSANTVITDVLPAGFEVVSVMSTTPGMSFIQSVGGPNGDQVTLTINLGTLGVTEQCETSFPTSGVVTIVAKVPEEFPNIFVTNTASITSSNCLAENNLDDNTSSVTTEISHEPRLGPGLAFPAASEASDDKAGSVLFFPLYTSSGALSGAQNTRISITNTDQYLAATIHLFVVDGQTCAPQDAYVCLTPNQTVTFLASDFDPGITGYIAAVAVNGETGRPISHNYLIGDAYVKFSSGHALNYGAVSVAALQLNPSGVDPLSSTATLKFDGISYNRLPRILSVDSIPSPGEGNSTMIALHAIGGHMSQGGIPIGSLSGNLYDDRENNYSFVAPANNCQFRSLLTDSFPRTFVPFSAAIQPGHTGWMKIRAFNDVAILGVVLNFNPNAAASGSAFNQGHVLHTYTLTDTATLTIPVDFPSC